MVDNDIELMGRRRKASENAIQNLQTGTYSAQGEKISWTYYDTMLVSATVLTNRLFTVGLGGGSTPKQYSETNMTTSGQLPQGQHFTIHAIKAQYFSSGVKATADIQKLYTLISNTYVRFQIPGKDSMGTWKLQELMGIPLAFQVTPTVAGNNESIASIGRFLGVYTLNIPLVLGALTPFEVQVVHTAAPDASLANDRITINLCGELVRAS